MYTMGSTPRPMADAMLAEIPGVANAGRMSDESQQILFAAGEKSLYMNGRYADPALLSMFTITFKEGSAKNALTQPRTMLLTESAAEKLFGGSAQAVGRVVRIDNDKNFTITAVVQDMPGNSTLKFEWLAPYM